MAWSCKTCGQTHDSIPLSFAADYPDNYANMSDDQRDLRAIIGSDQCVIDEEQFYIRGCLEIPLHGQEEPFLWGLWASLWKADYDHISDTWETPERENSTGPFKGRLSNNLREYPFDTYNLTLTVQIQPVGQRPLFFVDEPGHPLSIAQQNGISLEEAHELASNILHGNSSAALEPLN